MAIAAVQRLNHAVLYVGSVERSVAFYTAHLGMEAVYQFPGAAFMRSAGSPNDHDLGLFEIGASNPGPQRGRRGLYHLAWQVDTIEDLATIRTRLLDAGSLVGESDHGASKSLYALDPDGIEFEIMWATPMTSRGGSVGVAPLDLNAELARWAGVGTGHEANITASA
jgi:catechol-2,3-dioxygenase